MVARRPAGGSRSSSCGPPRARPYIGGSQNNSILELTLGYNGLGRLTGNETGSVGGGGGGAGGGMWGATGLGPDVQRRDRRPDRLAAPGRADPAGRRPVAHAAAPPRTDARRAACIVWGGWLLVTGADLQLHGRHLPRVLHGRPGPGDRRARRHRRPGAVAAPARLARLASPWPRRRRVDRRLVASSCSSRTPDCVPVAARRACWSSGMAAALLLLVVVRLHRRAVAVVVAAAVVAGAGRPRGVPLSTPSPPPHTGSDPDAPGRRPAAAAVAGGPGGGPGGAGPVGAAARRHGARPARRRAARPAAPDGGGGMGGLLDGSTPSTEVAAAAAAPTPAQLHLGGRGRRLQHARRATSWRPSCR